jgi:hypothetical protein
MYVFIRLFIPMYIHVFILEVCILDSCIYMNVYIAVALNVLADNHRQRFRCIYLCAVCIYSHDYRRMHIHVYTYIFIGCVYMSISSGSSECPSR